jgi:hypothetical protein
MGDGVKGHITKGPIHAKVDAALNRQDQPGGPFVRRAAFLDALTKAKTAEDYLALIQAEGVDATTAGYLRNTWYSSSATAPKGWWLHLQPIYPILQQGLIKALQEAGDQLLIDSYWLPAANATAVEVVVARSARQVTRLILTPPSDGPMNPRHTPAPMWVVRGRAGAQEQPGLVTIDEVVESVSGNVVTWQRRELP